jgi:hypothetical protein
MGLKVTCGCEATRVTAGERSDTETVTLRSERGDGKRAISTSPVAYSTCGIRRPEWACENPQAVSCSLWIPQRKSTMASIDSHIFTKGEWTLCMGFSPS